MPQYGNNSRDDNYLNNGELGTTTTTASTIETTITTTAIINAKISTTNLNILMGKSVGSMAPPWLQSMNLQPCNLPTESICPKMPIIKRQTLQCFGDGIINCDANVGSMCKLFERQSNPSNRLQNGPIKMSDFNYFFCNQPLTTAECMGIVECMSSGKVAPISTTEPSTVEVTSSTTSSSSIVEILKEDSQLNGYETEIEPETILPNRRNEPNRYYTATKEYTTTTNSPAETEMPVSVWGSNTGVSLGHRQSLKHEPNLATNKKNQKLSRMQVGMIGALIALGSFMFIAVAAVAYYS